MTSSKTILNFYFYGDIMHNRTNDDSNNNNLFLLPFLSLDVRGSFFVHFKLQAKLF